MLCGVFKDGKGRRERKCLEIIGGAADTRASGSKMGVDLAGVEISVS